MSKRQPVSLQERRALRMAAWGGGPGALGYADGYDVLPPNPPADREGAQRYTVGYDLGLEQRRGQRAAEGNQR